MRLVPVEQHRNPRNKVMKILDEFINLNIGCAEVKNTGDYTDNDSMYSSLRSTIHKYPEYGDKIYACMKDKKVYMVRK